MGKREARGERPGGLLRLGAHKSRKSRDTRDLVPGRSPVWPRSRKKKGREGKDADKWGPPGSGKKGRRGAWAGLLGWAVHWGTGCWAAAYGHGVASSFFLFYFLFCFPKNILQIKF